MTYYFRRAQFRDQNDPVEKHPPKNPVRFVDHFKNRFLKNKNMNEHTAEGISRSVSKRTDLEILRGWLSAFLFLEIYF